MAPRPRSLPLHLSAALLLASSSSVSHARSDVEFAQLSELESLVPGFGSAAPVLGTNVDGTSILSNFWDAYSERQFFWRVSGHSQYESPGSDAVDWSAGVWCSDLEFGDFDGGQLGFTGRCLMIALDEEYQSNAAAAGAQLDAPLDYEDMEDIEGFDETADVLDINDLADETSALDEEGGEDLAPVAPTFDSLALSHPMSVSSSHVSALNGFRVAWHGVTDNYVEAAMDDGRPFMSASAWEVHDAGDDNPNAASSSFSSVETVEWMDAEAFATLVGIEGEGGTFDPTSFAARYNETWTALYSLYESDVDDGDYGEYMEDLVLEESEIDEDGEGGDTIGEDDEDEEEGEGSEETNDEVAPDGYAATNGGDGGADANAGEIRSASSGAVHCWNGPRSFVLALGASVLLAAAI